MDYSLLMTIVIKPFKNVEYFMQKHAFKANANRDSGVSNDKNLHFSSFKDFNSQKKLVIGELDNGVRGKHGQKVEDNITFLMREQTKEKQITYHIYEPYDIASIRLYEEEKEN